MPGDFMPSKAFIFGFFKFVTDGRGLLYDETPPSPISTMYFRSLELHFD